MRALLSILLVTVLTCGIFSMDAQAKRFGGGRSFGVSRSISSFSRPQALNAPFQRNIPGKSWLGPAFGFLAGGLLASLFFSNGFGSGLLTWLAVAIAVYLIVSLFRRKTTSQPPGYQAFQYTEQQRTTASPLTGAIHRPMHFDEDQFLRDAKVQFIRLQTAYDQKNMNDLRQFTSPQVFAEIQMQLQERGDAPNVTEVVSLNAELLDVSEEMSGIVSTVKFSGLIREEINGNAEPFTEIWHFQKILPNPDWVVAGIQQN